MLAQCWDSFVNGGSVLNLHWVIDPCLLYVYIQLCIVCGFTACLTIYLHREMNKYHRDIYNFISLNLTGYIQAQPIGNCKKIK